MPVRRILQFSRLKALLPTSLNSGALLTTRQPSSISWSPSTLGNKLQRLAAEDPQRLRLLENLVDELLRTLEND